MIKSLNFRWVLIAIVLLFSLYKVWPSLTYYSMGVEEKDQFELDDPETLMDLQGQAINLGLDLQGGMHVILEVDLPILAHNLADKKNDDLINTIESAKNIALKHSTEFFDEFEQLAMKSDLNLIKYYSTLDGLSGRANDDVISTLKEHGENAVNSALEIIRNRVDEFGVSEPIIKKAGKNRVIAELAGVKDTERARQLIQRTALLEFTLVKKNEALQPVLEKIDAALKVEDGLLGDTTATAVDIDTTATELDDQINVVETETDTSDIFAETDTSDIDDLFDQLDDEVPQDLFEASEEVLKDKPFSGYVRSFPNGFGIFAADINKFNALLEREDVQKLIPSDAVFRWGNRKQTAATEDGTQISYKNIWYLTKEPALTGGVVTEASASLGGVGTDETGQAVVYLTMDSKGAKTWGRFTGANIERNVAIVLDNKVYMAPVISDRIPGGRTQISGLNDIDEAKDIANVLRAGKLPAPVNIIEERTVGPSLGQDAINAGTMAMIFGFIVVMLFMAVYYKGAGLLANLSLILNLVIVLGVLAMLNATLTLPGIAGLILTIGMAVDANVIIFERIREELNKGKTVRASIDSGYSRAFTTILDANVTTLIAAFVLAWLGSGPIKGFAVTLSVGIISSMFTAVFVTRTIFMIFGNKKPLKQLSIG